MSYPVKVGQFYLVCPGYEAGLCIYGEKSDGVTDGKSMAPIRVFSGHVAEYIMLQNAAHLPFLTLSDVLLADDRHMLRRSSHFETQRILPLSASKKLS